MDNGTLALFLSPVLIFITALLTQWVVRRNAKDNIEVGRFEANLEAYRGRAESAESKLKELDLKMNETLERVGTLEAQYTAQARQLTRIKTVVQDWFKALKLAWPKDGLPMPVPSEEDLELLGITQPKK